MIEGMRIVPAAKGDADEIYALYHSLIDMPCSTWDEEYPTREIVGHDLDMSCVLTMRDEAGRIVSAIVVCDDDEEFEQTDAKWYPDVKRWATLSRLGVAKEIQGRGVAKEMLRAAMALAREQGCDAVRFLVARDNPYPQRAYAKLEFDVCGEAVLFDMPWLCYQKRL